MTDLGNFDSSKHENMRTFTVVPKGEYPMQIVSSKKKETKAKDGWFLKLEMEIISGEHKGHKIWNNLNLWNKSEKAVEIAQQELATICRAVGILSPKTSEALHKIPFTGSVAISPAQGKYPESNEMMGYKPYSASGSQLKASPPSAGGGKPPWVNTKEEKGTSSEKSFDGPVEELAEVDDIPI